MGVFTGCSNKSNSFSCCNLEHEFKKYDYLQANSLAVPLNTIRGVANKQMSRNIFIHDATIEFNKKVTLFINEAFYSYQRGNKYALQSYAVNKYCNKINFITQNETNQTIVKRELNKFKTNWVRDYNNNIKNKLREGISFSEFDGCNGNARNWRNSFSNYIALGQAKEEKEKFEMYRRGYDDCLRGSIKKAEIKKKKEQKNGN
jgi:hypothetical protein